MTQLLVSVRSAEEARLAIEGGAALIDVKEPHLGSLGAASPEVWRAVAETVDGTRRLSAALGELRDFLRIDASALASYHFAKLGLAGCADHPDWIDQWRTALRSLPPHVQPVAVAYADYATCAAPSPDEVLEVGHSLGCRALLIDTYDKSRGGLLGHLSVTTLDSLVGAARRRRLLTVLAGSLNRDDVPRLLPLAPDFLAVRGAVCATSRAGSIDGELVRSFAASLGGQRIHER
jgi:uncharacterized protein (UPF0264 family)